MAYPYRHDRETLVLSRYFGDNRRAQDYLEQALAQNPASSEAYSHLAAVYLQKAQQSTRNQENYLRQKARYLSRAHRINPDDIEVQLRLAVTWCRLDRCSRARPHLEALLPFKQRLSRSSRSLMEQCMEMCM
jgi:tetratricopeptide (TPR) repeat protein